MVEHPVRGDDSAIDNDNNANHTRDDGVVEKTRSLAKVIKIYPFVGNEVRNCRYQQSNSISDQITVGDFCILMKVSEIF